MDDNYNDNVNDENNRVLRKVFLWVQCLMELRDG